MKQSSEPNREAENPLGDMVSHVLQGADLDEEVRVVRSRGIDTDTQDFDELKIGLAALQRLLSGAESDLDGSAGNTR